jgi:hypothetical protein
LQELKLRDIPQACSHEKQSSCFFNGTSGTIHGVASKRKRIKVKIEAQPVVSASRTAYRKRKAWLKGCVSNAVRSYSSTYAIMVQILLADKPLIPQIGSRLAATEIQGLPGCRWWWW